MLAAFLRFPNSGFMRICFFSNDRKMSFNFRTNHVARVKLTCPPDHPCLFPQKPAVHSGRESWWGWLGHLITVKHDGRGSAGADPAVRDQSGPAEPEVGVRHAAAACFSGGKSAVSVVPAEPLGFPVCSFSLMSAPYGGCKWLLFNRTDGGHVAGRFWQLCPMPVLGDSSSPVP